MALMSPPGPNTKTMSNAPECVFLERCTNDERVMTITGLSPLGPSRITVSDERGDVASVTRVKELWVCWPAHKMALRYPSMGSRIHPGYRVFSLRPRWGRTPSFVHLFYAL